MDPITTPLSLEMAAADSPQFRAAVIRFEIDLDTFIGWLEKFIAVWRHYFREYIKKNEALAAIVSTTSEIHFHQNPQLWKSCASRLQATYHAQNKLVDDMLDKIEPLERLLKDSRRIKSDLRNFERSLERFETALQRFSAVSPSKEPSVLKEESSVLFEYRKQYIHAALGICTTIIVFRTSLYEKLLEVLHETAVCTMQFHKDVTQMQEVALADTLEARKNTLHSRLLSQIETKRKTLEEGTIAKCNPAQSSPSEPSAPIDSEGTTVYKEGYIFSRAARGWTRKWLRLSTGGLSYRTLSVTKPGVLLTSLALNVLICNVRAVQIEDRRNCFELAVARRKPVQFQAETEDDLREWISAIEQAKKDALKNPSSDFVLSNTPANGTIIEYDDEGGPLSTINELPPVTPADGESEDEDAEETPFEAQQNDAAAESMELVYSDPALRKENVKLHRILRQVPRDDFVMDAFSLGWQKDIVIHGKLYLTYDRICFHSNILGFVNILVVDTADVEDVVLRRGPLYSSLIITCKDNSQHTFKLFLKDEQKFNAIKLAWQNVKAEPRLSRQDLLHAIHQRKPSPAPRSVEDTTALSLSDAREPTLPTTEEEVPKTETDDSALPPDFQAPSSPVDCGCGADHQEKREVDDIIQAPAKKVFETLFSDTTKFWAERFHPPRGETGRQQKPWVNDTREVRYTMPVNNPMVKVKEAEVITKQTIIKQQPHILYIVQQQSETPALPYPDAFSPVTRFCITWVSPTSCRFVITSGVIFFKSPMMKGIIKKAAMAGLAESAAQTLPLLKAEVEQKTQGKPVPATATLPNGSTSESAKRSSEVSQGAATTPGDSAPLKVNGTSDGTNGTWFRVLLALLLCSLLLHGWQLGRQGTTHNDTRDNSYTRSRVGTIRAVEAEWARVLGVGANERHRFRKFLKLHHPLIVRDEINAENYSSPSARDGRPSSSYNGPPVRAKYRNAAHLTTFRILADLQSYVEDLRTEINALDADLDEVEGSLMMVMWQNWLLDEGRPGLPASGRV
ncbi:uncharacterized protein EV422DRAFT_538396 [Fimicolochytrium jonesii]|uniref:uncharacterized protein n=1 Tax=Fimicolochytrium jonesii TaxID=1396493 RepID=UPI0022FE5125|nr:uncharacterized protein EV422DRAFT_538396 [Fimicolochytrium jonesii]KAI8818382.1 hypothetical protein EV422DRAFT_538396 [Fimicolochytrium jonesii]